MKKSEAAVQALFARTTKGQDMAVIQKDLPCISFLNCHHLTAAKKKKKSS